MKKIVIGKKREKESDENRIKDKSADYLFIAGITAMCVSLIIPMKTGESDISRDNSVQVSSTPVFAREELVMPEKDVSSNPGDESIFEHIGEFFAEMIRGE